MREQLWGSIPEDLQRVQKWCIAGEDKSPYTHTGHRASVVNPEHWGDWYSVTTVAASRGAHIGFVLGEDDPFTCIDLDIKDADNESNPEKWTSPDQLAFFHRVIEYFNSYTEYSRSGKGFHIWIRGDIGAGCRRNGLEVYSRERFIISTGNVYRDMPIEERQWQLDEMLPLLQSPAETEKTVLVEVDAILTDEQIWTRASEAANGEKFRTLWNCNFEQNDLGYPSQSEADSSLMETLCFYSASNEQVRRLFRLSELGKREKAVKNDRYLNETLGFVRGVLAREEKRRNAQVTQGRELAQRLIANMQTKKKIEIKTYENPQNLMEVPNHTQLDWPPGLVGVIAKWMFSNAPRPVREVAIVSALGVMAGVCGRAYSISGSGLNLYMVLVARSAVGKEAMHSGISKLVHTMASASAPFTHFINFNNFASGPALTKALAGDVNSFLNVAGEWGRKLRGMAEDGTNAAMASLRTTMTDLYQKSSPGTIVGGIGYSDKEKNVGSMDGIAYSMIGETTPDTFYESLTNTMMQDGFMSRFVIIEYTGLRPPLSHAVMTEFPDFYRDKLAKIANDAFTHSQGKMTGAVDVCMTEQAGRMLYEFDKHCDTEINKTDDEAWRQMWNRAHLKALKIAGLLAVADGSEAPTVTEEHAQWALDVVNRDIRIMSRKMLEGDIGEGDMTRERKLLAVLRDYLQEPMSPGYRLPDEMRHQGVVARKYLQIRVQRVNAFLKHRNGQSAALDGTLKSLSDSGYIVEVAKDKIPSEWAFSGKCYRILALPDIS